jgi:hypothetical protein
MRLMEDKKNKNKKQVPAKRLRIVELSIKLDDPMFPLLSSHSASPRHRRFSFPWP